MLFGFAREITKFKSRNPQEMSYLRFVKLILATIYPPKIGGILYCVMIQNAGEYDNSRENAYLSTVSSNKQTTDDGSDNMKAISLIPHTNTPCE